MRQALGALLLAAALCLCCACARIEYETDEETEAETAAEVDIEETMPQYSYHPSPDGSRILRMRHNVVEDVTYYDELSVADSASGEILHRVNLCETLGYLHGHEEYSAHWSPDGQYIIIVRLGTTLKYGAAVGVFGVDTQDFWMPPSTVDVYTEHWRSDRTLPEVSDVEFRIWGVESWTEEGCAVLATQYDVGTRQISARITVDVRNRCVTDRVWEETGMPVSESRTSAE